MKQRILKNIAAGMAGLMLISCANWGVTARAWTPQRARHVGDPPIFSFRPDEVNSSGPILRCASN